MKFLYYAAAIATAAAVRLRQVPVAKHLLGVSKEIPDPEDVWNHFDADNSGTWNMTEAKKAFNATFDYFNQSKPADLMHEVEKGFNETDTDGNGEVTPKEMGVYLFKMIDSNSDGFWEPKEVFEAIKHIAEFTGNKLKPEWRQMVSDVMEEVDTNNDNKVSPKEVFDALKLHGIPDINDLFMDKKERKERREDRRERRERGAHEIPDPAEVWADFDTNGDNRWNLTEAKTAFKAGMEHFNYSLPDNWEGIVEEIFNHTDRNGDGQLSPREIGAALFAEIDSNDDGVWSFKEVKEAIKKLAEFSGNKLKDGWQDQVKTAFDAGDVNGDGKATMKEVRNYLKEHGIPDFNDLFE